MSQQTMNISVAKIRTLATQACVVSGSSIATALALVDATISAACVGSRQLGLPHFLDYIESLRAGRINGHARPQIRYILPAFIHADADGGVQQLGFDMVYDDFKKRVTTFGIAVFTQQNGFTAGELGYYTRRLAADGLMAMAFANGPALMTVPGSKQKVYCTNPIAFGAPAGTDHRPVVIDQATSAAAFVKVRRAAQDHQTIPDDWAVDQSGRSTVDPNEAMAGALLPFGGYKGANLALMVELLAAGLSGAAWSLDQGEFLRGSTSLNAGLTVLAIAPVATDQPVGERINAHLRRLHSHGVHIPGQNGADYDERTNLEVPIELLRAIEEAAAGKS